MARETKIAILLIVIGICIPLVALPFVTGYSKDKSLWDNFSSVGIPLTKGKPAESVSQGVPGNPQANPGAPKAIPPIKLPFRVFVAFTVIFIFFAVLTLDKARQQRKAALKKPDQPQE